MRLTAAPFQLSKKMYATIQYKKIKKKQKNNGRR